MNDPRYSTGILSPHQVEDVAGVGMAGGGDPGPGLAADPPEHVLLVVHLVHHHGGAAEEEVADLVVVGLGRGD